MPRRPRSLQLLPLPSLAADTDTIGYSRVSTEDQAREEKTSLADQHRAIEQLALRLRRTLQPAAIFTDPGASGTSAEGRPAFMAMVQWCQAHPQAASTPGAVLVLNDSRFGRFTDPDEAGFWRTTLARCGWRVRYVEGDDTEDVVTRSVMRAIGGATASAYSHTLRANQQRAARSVAAQGRWRCEAPFGYRRLATRLTGESVVLDVGQRKADDQTVRLTPGPEREQELVRWAFAAYASGTHSFDSLVGELLERWPARKWSRGVVGAMLRNPAYAGDVVVGRRAGKVTVDPAHWLATPDAHQALVDRLTWERVQRKMAVNRGKRTGRQTTYLLTGMLTCGTCGSAYIGGGGARGPEREPDYHRFYKDGNAKCRPGGTISKRVVEPMVIAAVARVVSAPTVQRVIAQEIEAALEGLGAEQKGRRASLATERESLAEERDRLIAAVGRGLLSDKEAAPALKRVRDELARTESESERTRFASRSVDRLASERDRIVALAADFAAQAKRLSGRALKELLRPWIASAVFDKVQRTVTLHIRRIPEVGMGLDGDGSLRRDGRKHGSSRDVVRAVLHLKQGERRIVVGGRR